MSLSGLKNQIALLFWIAMGIGASTLLPGTALAETCCATDVSICWGYNEPRPACPGDEPEATTNDDGDGADTTSVTCPQGQRQCRPSDSNGCTPGQCIPDPECQADLRELADQELPECERAQEAANQGCGNDAMREMGPLNTEAKELLKTIESGSGKNTANCCKLRTLATNYNEKSTNFINACDPRIDTCRTVCYDRVLSRAAEVAERCGDSPELQTIMQNARNQTRTCAALKQGTMSARQQQKEMTTAKTSAEACVKSTAGSTSDIATVCAGAEKAEDDGGALATDPVVAADPAAAAEPAAPGTSGDSSSSGTDTASGNKENQKKQQQGGGDMSGALGGLMGMLGQMMQPKPEGEKAKPAELAADDCRRAENAQSQICICRVNPRLPGCMLNQSNNEQPSSAFQGGGTGGAPLTQDTTGSVNIPSVGGPMFPGMGENPVGGGGPSGVMAAGGSGGLGGGGGMRPSGDDRPRGPGGSSLSANIYEGSRGGGAAGGGSFGSRFSGSRGMPDIRSGSSPARDPSNMPGYTLGPVVHNPAFQKFRAKEPEGITALVGKDPKFFIHGSHRNLFQIMSERYRNLENPIDLP